MKKVFTLFLAVLGIAITFSSCKKSSQSPTGAATSMKLTYNGTAVSFNTCLAINATVNAANETLITGENVNGTNVSDNSFELDIFHDISTIKAGQTFSVGSTIAQAESLTLFFYPNSTDIFASQPGNPEGIVTITGVTATTISGTFSGKLYDESDFSGTALKYTITNGSFTALISK